MITFERAKENALKTMENLGFSSLLLCDGRELTDSWLFSFATKDKRYVPDIVKRVYKDDGRVVPFYALSEEEERNDEYNKKFVRDFVITEGCHW